MEWKDFKEYLHHYGGSVNSLANYIGISSNYLRILGKNKKFNRVQINYIKEYLKLLHADADVAYKLSKFTSSL